MSIGPLPGLIGSAAGAPLAQTKGSEVERQSNENSAARRQADGADRAEMASGIGQTAEDQETSERDADGRRIWEIDERKKKQEDEQAAAARQSRDASGQSGNHLDLSG